MRFRKVKIVRGQEVVEYSENLQDWRRHVLVNPDQLMDGQYTKYRNSWKKIGKKMQLENVHWFVLDAETDEKCVEAAICSSDGGRGRKSMLVFQQTVDVLVDNGPVLGFYFLHHTWEDLLDITPVLMIEG